MNFAPANFGMVGAFSLIELLVSLAVASVLMMVAVPSFDAINVRNQLATSYNGLLEGFYVARESAITLNRQVSLCGGVSNCDGDWGSGTWRVFLDDNHNGLLDSGESLLVERTARVPSYIQIEGNGPFRRAVIFSPLGHGEWSSGAFAAGTLRVCVRKPVSPNAVDLVLSRSGRVRTEHHDFSGGCPGL